MSECEKNEDFFNIMNLYFLLLLWYSIQSHPFICAGNVITMILLRLYVNFMSNNMGNRAMSIALRVLLIRISIGYLCYHSLIVGQLLKKNHLHL